MRRPEPLQRWRAFGGVVVLMGLALIGAAPSATVLPMQEAWAEPAPTMAPPAMPMISGGMPCALCYIAPPPSPHAFTGEGQEPESLIWWVLAQPTPTEFRFAATLCRCDRVPIRVALCRWLD